MLIIFLLIGILSIAGGILWGSLRRWQNEAPIPITIMGVFFSLASFVLTCVAITQTVSASTIEQKVLIYEEENKAIEQDIQAIINSYLQFEKDIYNNVNIEDYEGDRLLLLTQLYPDLKSNVLIQTQIELHITNTAEIKTLKEQLLNTDIWAWWLYFKPIRK